MNEQMFFAIGFFVFAVLMIGLALTIYEFRHGAPRRQQKRAERRMQREAKAD